MPSDDDGEQGGVLDGDVGGDVFDKVVVDVVPLVVVVVVVVAFDVADVDDLLPKKKRRNVDVRLVRKPELDAESPDAALDCAAVLDDVIVVVVVVVVVVKVVVDERGLRASAASLRISLNRSRA